MGSCHSLLLTSDATVEACGANSSGECNVPEKTWSKCKWLARRTLEIRYVASHPQGPGKLVLQACWAGDLIKIVRLSGELVSEGMVDSSQTLQDLQCHLTRELQIAPGLFDVIFPSGKLL